MRWWLGGTVSWLRDVTEARRDCEMVARESGGDQVNEAMETRSLYKCSSYAHIVLRIIFQILVLIY